MNRAILQLLVTIVLVAACGAGGNDPQEPPQGMDTLGGSGPVTFAVFGNTGRVLDDGTAFDALADQANRIGIDFAVDLGNSLPPGVPAEGADLFRDTVDDARGRFDAPVYPVAGPDDIFDFASDLGYADRYGPLWYGFTRGGIRFLVLSTEDEGYRSGFGTRPRIGEEQLGWFMDELAALSTDTPAVLFMNRPLWTDAPEIWRGQLLPLIQTSSVVLVVACSPDGLMDWGTVDGIHALTTGCTGPSDELGPGCFPHFLRVTMNGEHMLFGTLLPDGSVTEGIPVNLTTRRNTESLIQALTIPPVETGTGWEVSHTHDLSIENQFPAPLTGSVTFIPHRSTRWDIRPPSDTFTIRPGERRTIHVQLSGEAPELGPLPRYRATMETAGTRIIEIDQPLTIVPPALRTVERIAVRAQTVEVIPYQFEGEPLTIPVDIGSIDTCGRLIIYREESGGIAECLYISPLVDFNPGLNHFTWDGTGLDGEPAPAGDIVYYLFAYNKEAPCTWVADGPPAPGGTSTVTRNLAGHIVETHTDTSIIRYPLDDSPGAPAVTTTVSVESLLDGLPLIGYARDNEGSLFLGTRRGIICATIQNGQTVPVRSFGDGGYLRFNDYRGRTPGPPRYANGRLLAGIGGGNGAGPSIVMFDAISGDMLSEIELSPFYGELAEPPVIATDRDGIICAHPMSGIVLRLSYTGGLIWENDHGDSRIGALDSDGASYTYGVGIDQYGFSYVGTPGTSARCGVLGPDGRGLFRVILVQLPGLRTTRTVPVIEGADTDGLYLVTSGGDQPYIFHIPFTVRRGRIVHTSETFTEEEG